MKFFISGGFFLCFWGWFDVLWFRFILVASSANWLQCSSSWTSLVLPEKHSVCFYYFFTHVSLLVVTQPGVFIFLVKSTKPGNNLTFIMQIWQAGSFLQVPEVGSEPELWPCFLFSECVWAPHPSPPSASGFPPVFPRLHWPWPLCLGGPGPAWPPPPPPATRRCPKSTESWQRRSRRHKARGFCSCCF